MTDFTNYPIWANAGTISQPLFVDSGWVCGTVNPEHMNWWYNRTDNALLALDARVTANTVAIDDLTTIVNNISTTAEASGLLGTYVKDSNANVSKFQSNSAGVANATVMKTFDHTIQNTGDVHLIVGYESNIVISPSGTSSCVGVVRLQLNNDFVIVNKYGTQKNGNPRAPISFHGGVVSMRNVNANYNWALIGQTPFPTYNQGDTVQLKLDAYLAPGNSGSIDLGLLKLVVMEIRATAN